MELEGKTKLSVHKLGDGDFKCLEEMVRKCIQTIPNVGAELKLEVEETQASIIHQTSNPWGRDRLEKNGYSLKLTWRKGERTGDIPDTELIIGEVD